jgi:hypothetical protein
MRRVMNPILSYCDLGGVRDWDNVTVREEESY